MRRKALTEKLDVRILEREDISTLLPSICNIFQKMRHKILPAAGKSCSGSERYLAIEPVCLILRNFNFLHLAKAADGVIVVHMLRYFYAHNCTILFKKQFPLLSTVRKSILIRCNLILIAE